MMCEHPTFFVEKHLIARKKYMCCECKEPIQAKEEYEQCKGVWDNAWHEFITCRRCADYRIVVMQERDYDDCTEFGELYYPEMEIPPWSPI